jgi:hypothetical protein
LNVIWPALGNITEKLNQQDAKIKCKLLDVKMTITEQYKLDAMIQDIDFRLDVKAAEYWTGVLFSL